MLKIKVQIITVINIIELEIQYGESCRAVKKIRRHYWFLEECS